MIIHLPKTKKGHDAIIVFVDRLTKMLHCVAAHTKITATELARQYFDSIFRLHGLSVNIVSDRDPKIMSQFWQGLFKFLGTKMNISTANHAETDGQTERANRTIEEILRSYISPHHDDWDDHLTAAEFAYNSSVNPSTGYSPFYLNYGFNPTTPLALLQPVQDASNVEAVNDFINRLSADIKRAQDNIKAAQDRQAKYANQHRRNHEFQVGDKVILKQSYFTNHTNPNRAANARKKFAPPQIGPFKITEVLSPVAIRLEFPKHFKSHNVVHVSYILPFRESDQFPSREAPPAPEPEIIDGEEHHHVERFLNHRFFRGQYLQYLVKWTGQADENNVWRPITILRQDLDMKTLSMLVEAYRNARSLPKNFTRPPPKSLHTAPVVRPSPKPVQAPVPSRSTRSLRDVAQRGRGRM
jgi:hypothetical protein